jgi:hypothetical protein
MGFLTDDEVRAIRLAGAEPLVIEGMSRQLRMVKVTGAKSVEIGQLHADQKGKDAQRKLFLAMLRASVVDEEGQFLTEDAAAQLFEVISARDALAITTRVTKSLNEAEDTRTKMGNSEASPGGVSSSDSAKP